MLTDMLSTGMVCDFKKRRLSTAWWRLRRVARGARSVALGAWRWELGAGSVALGAWRWARGARRVARGVLRSDLHDLRALRAMLSALYEA